ncbi:MAG: hypothetical protein V3T83_04855 [Acidobacteriota bacterium]
MKKILFGCLIIFLVGSVAAGLGFYFFIWSPVRDFAGKAEELATLDRQVENRQPHQAPADELLTRQQVDRFVSVQRSIRQSLGEDYQDFHAKIEELEQRRKSGGEEAGFFEVAGLVRDIFSMISQGKQAQVRALNEVGFSLEEYDWVRHKFYQALGASWANSSLEKILEAAQEGDIGAITAQEELKASVPEVNRQLVAPYQEEFTQWAGFAFFGL